MAEIETKETLASLRFWYIVFTAIFAVLAILFVRLYGVAAVQALSNITLLQFVVLVLATFRITRLVVADRLTQWVRDLCAIVSVSTDTTTGAPYVIRTKRVKGLRRAIGDIIGCPWCTGVWVALVVLAVYVEAAVYALPAAWIFLIVFAIAGGASIIQAFLPNQSTLVPERRPQPNICTECGQ